MRKHSHYFFPIPKGLTEADIYRLIDIVGITCPAAQHVFKKAAAAGRRGHKDLRKDWEDIRDTAIRKLEMLDEDDHTSDLVAQAANKIFGTPEPPAKHQQAILDGHEVDTDFDSEKARMPAIGTNGNDGGHYAPALPAGYSWADAPPDATVLVMATMTGRYHWADAFSNGARIYGGPSERMDLSRSSGWKLIARRPGSDPGWVVNIGEAPNLPGYTEVQFVREDGRRYTNRIDRLSWRRVGLPHDIVRYRIVEGR